MAKMYIFGYGFTPKGRAAVRNYGAPYSQSDSPPPPKKNTVYYALVMNEHSE